jgi:hypothetical protein
MFKNKSMELIILTVFELILTISVFIITYNIGIKSNILLMYVLSIIIYIICFINYKRGKDNA